MSKDNDNNDSWELDGNSGTNPARDFLGTTDSQPLVIRTNNVERARVAANGNVGIGANNTAPSLTLDVRGANILNRLGCPV